MLFSRYWVELFLDRIQEVGPWKRELINGGQMMSFMYKVQTTVWCFGSFPTSKKTHEHLSACMQANLGASWLSLQCFLSIYKSMFWGMWMQTKKTFHCSATVHIQQVLPYLIISCSLPIFPKRTTGFYFRHALEPPTSNLIDQDARSSCKSVNTSHPLTRLPFSNLR